MELLSLIPTVILGLLIHQQAKSHAKERAILLDRIQAPERVIYERSGKPESEPVHVPYDSGVWAPPPVSNGSAE